MLNFIPIIAFLLLSLCISFGADCNELTVGAGNFPPFFMEDTDDGIFLDLTREVFKLMPNHDVKFVFAPNKRLLYWVNNGKIDAACNIFKGSVTNAFLSAPLFRFSDVAVTLKKNNFNINKISDLAGRSVVTYQGATDLLGEE